MTVFQVIVLITVSWAALVSLSTGRINLRSGETEKGWMPRVFGALLLLAAILLVLRLIGAVPPPLLPTSAYAVAGLIVSAVLLQTVF